MVIRYVEYLDSLNSPEWRDKARAAKARAGWQCMLCPSTKELEAHHRTYVRLKNELLSDLVVLCDSCHRKHHGTFDECRERQLLLPYRDDLPEAA